MSMKRRMLRWALGLMCFTSACVTHSQSYEHSLKILEAEPSDTTRQLFEQLFRRSTSVTVYYTPVQSMGRSEFSRDEAERYVRYIVTYQCGSSCEYELPELQRRLSSGRLVQGDCGRPIGIVVFFSSMELPQFESLYVASHGLCFSIAGRSYFVEQRNSLAELIDPLQRVLQRGT